MLKLTGNPIVADDIELSTLNSIIGLHSASDRWVTRGPMLLAYDRKYNTVDLTAVPVLDACGLRGKLAAVNDAIVAIDFAVDDQNLRLCDFASVGEGGSPYLSWLRVKNAPKTNFSRHNPLRSGR